MSATLFVAIGAGIAVLTAVHTPLFCGDDKSVAFL